MGFYRDLPSGNITMANSTFPRKNCYQWPFSIQVAISQIARGYFQENPIKPWVFLGFSYGFPMVFHRFPMVFLWVFHGFPMVFLWFTIWDPNICSRQVVFQWPGASARQLPQREDGQTITASPARHLVVSERMPNLGAYLNGLTFHGKIYRKPEIFPWNMGFSCNFSVKPINWISYYSI